MDRVTAGPEASGAKSPLWIAYGLLCLTNLFWAGNWITGRALRTAFEPIELTFWRWLIAALILAPFALPTLAGKWRVIRARAGLLALLALTGVILFQILVYLGLRTTTAVNALLFNSSSPLFMLICSWVMERETAKGRQLFGMLVSLAGIMIIMGRGELADILQFDFHLGDAWILLAMPCWGIYSVLLKRRPPEFNGNELLFVVVVIGVLLMAPAFALNALYSHPQMPTPGEVAGIVYTGLFGSAGAFICWNKAVVRVGANVAGFSMHLLPVFGTVLAIIFLGEELHWFHIVGIATILLGVFVATRPG